VRGCLLPSGEGWVESTMPSTREKEIMMRFPRRPLLGSS
jgi:hypothetical protein